jgi:hypothetical protein
MVNSTQMWVIAGSMVVIAATAVVALLGAALLTMILLAGGDGSVPVQIQPHHNTSSR